MDIAEIREGIKETLGTIEGLTIYSHAPANPNPPCVVITTQSPFIDYYVANAKGLAQLNFNLQVLVARQDDKRAQERLDEFLSAGTGAARSIVDALESDPSLDGSCQSSKVEQASDYYSTDSGGTALGAVSLSFTVYASRN
jgi:hypothetical protein